MDFNDREDQLVIHTAARVANSSLSFTRWTAARRFRFESTRSATVTLPIGPTSTRFGRSGPITTHGRSATRSSRTNERAIRPRACGGTRRSGRAEVLTTPRGSIGRTRGRNDRRTRAGRRRTSAWAVDRLHRGYAPDGGDDRGRSGAGVARSRRDVRGESCRPRCEDGALDGASSRRNRQSGERKAVSAYPPLLAVCRRRR